MTEHEQRDRTADDLEPADPGDLGIPEGRPDDARVEGAHVLASQAREHLEPQGFDRQQILEWAEAFVREEEAGDVEAFLRWVRAQER